MTSSIRILTTEILAHIALFVDNPANFSGVCRFWQSVQTAAYDKLKKEYSDSPVLSPLVKEITKDAALDGEELSNLQIVKNVYKRVIGGVRGLNGAALLNQTSNQRLSPPRLEKLYKWVEGREKALSLIILFQSIFEEVPEAEKFFGTLTNDSNVVKARKIRQWMVDDENESLFEDVEDLDIRGKNLKYLPSEIGLFTSLKTMVLSDNKLRSLPPEIGDLSELLVLTVDNNLLHTIPSEIGKLSQLNDLNLDNNYLESLPSEIGMLEELNELYIANNCLTDLPPEVENLQSLKKINISNNEIEEFPDALAKLPDLRKCILYNFNGSE